MTQVNISQKDADNLIKDKIFDHDDSVFFDEEFFLDLLKHSLSLNVSEKQRVIDSVPNLEQHQFDELIKVFLEEREKFRELMKEHPEDIKKLVEKQKKEWLEIAELYKISELKNSAKKEEQAKIDDIKSSLWL